MSAPDGLPGRIDRSFVMAVLRTLLRFETQNPPGNEEPALLALRDLLAAAGLEARYLPSAPGRGNLVAVLRGASGGPNLVLNGHVDTQPIAGGWTRDPLGGVIEDGRIYGCGAGDMKSGVAALAGAVAAAAKIERRGDLIFVASCDEVSGGHLGVGALIDELRTLRPDMAIVGEPTLGDVVIGARGVVWVELAVAGRTGQANKAGCGVNAISVMAEILGALEAWAARTLPAIKHAWLPSPTLNIGRISGGLKENTVAAHCVAHLDRRLVIGEDPDAVLADLLAIAQPLAEARGATVSVRRTLYVPPACIAPDAPIVAACSAAFSAVTGRTGGLRATGGFTDAHFFVDELGIDAVNFGPWYLTPHPSGSFTDIPDEFAHVEEIVQGARVYARLIEDLQCRP